MANAAAARQTIWQRVEAEHDRARQAVLMWQERCRYNPSEENLNALNAAIALLLAAPKFPAGIDVIREGACPIGAIQPIACFVCSFGHMTECHHPNDCATARCSHLRQE